MSEKVLLVDDEKEFLEIMSQRMSAMGMTVTTAGSAEQALAILGKETFDAIVMDFQMPEMDGMEALKAIKDKKPELQIILLTGYATVEKTVEAMKIGAADFLEKPAANATVCDSQIPVSKNRSGNSSRTGSNLFP